jgi:DNA polymerase-4
MARKILHIDLDAFFCSVEEQQDPSLSGKPFAVGGKPGERGVVASCSYAARRFGVCSAMPMARALRLCPELIVVPSRHGLYGRVSERVMQHLHELTPLVEQVSIDEAFLDVSDLPQPGELIARSLQTRIREQEGLPCSLGVAANRLLAKTANDIGKAANRGEGPPNAITVVPPGREAEFLAPLPVETLWGVGPKTAERLNEMGIKTIGDLALWHPSDLAFRFGKAGEELALRAQGIDDRPIITFHEAKSISHETTFTRDIQDEHSLRQTIRRMSEDVGRRLRQEALAGSTVRIKLRWPDFTTITRQITLEQPTDQDAEITTAALALFEANWTRGQPVRLIGVAVSGLGPLVRQLSMWDEGSEKDRRLQSAIDEIRDRFGEGVIRRGANRNHGSPAGWNNHLP